MPQNPCGAGLLEAFLPIFSVAGCRSLFRPCVHCEIWYPTHFHLRHRDEDQPSVAGCRSLFRPCVHCEIWHLTHIHLRHRDENRQIARSPDRQINRPTTTILRQRRTLGHFLAELTLSESASDDHGSR